jgi:hypothetical protein
MTRTHVHRCDGCGARMRCSAPWDPDSVDSGGDHCTAEPREGEMLCEDCASGRPQKARCQFCEEPLVQDDDGTWIDDATGGDCCSGNAAGENENDVHVAEGGD